MDKQTILIIIGLVIILLLINLLHSDIFQIKKIVIEGNQLLTAHYIQNFVELEPGSNIFAIDCQQIRKKMIMLPQLKKVTVTRKLPNKLVIKIEERKPIAIVPFQTAYCLIDHQGWILQVVNNLSAQEWPLIKGSKISKKQKKIQITPELKTAIKYLQELSGAVKKEVTEINISQSGFKLVLNEGGIVKLGQEFDPIKKAKVFSSIYQDVKKRGLQIKYVDLRYNKHSFIKTK